MSAPTYGNWRRPSSPGLGRLGLLGTAGLMAGAMLVIIVLAVGGLLAGAVTVVLVALVLVPVIPDRWGRTGYQRLAERAGWFSARRQGHHLYLAGPLSRTPTSTCRLPGLAASLTASDALDALGDPFVVLHHPGSGHVSTVLEASPPGDTMVDGHQVDEMVAQWGQWLSGLGHEAGLVAAAVTIESTPDTGVRLHRAVEARLSPSAPAMATAAMADVVHTLQAGSATVTCRVTLTWTRARLGAKRRSVEDLTVEIGSRLPQLAQGLAGTGAGSVTAMTTATLAAAVRCAFDPAVAQAIDEAGDTPDIDWADAGPLSAEEHAGHYVHDSAVSVSWVMGEAPRGAVRSSILRRLLEPHREVARKRVTLLYRPYTPGRAAELVDSDVLDASFNAQSRKVIRARDHQSVNSAKRTAEEEATGAGLVRFGAIVTATVEGDRDAVERCCSVIDHLGTSARVRLRRAQRSQAATFTAGLPLGLVLPQHVAFPGEWRERV